MRRRTASEPCRRRPWFPPRDLPEVLKPGWPAGRAERRRPAAAVQRTRRDDLMWGKIAILRDGHEARESTVGRILKTLMCLSRRSCAATGRAPRQARRLPKKPSRQAKSSDPLSSRPGRPSSPPMTPSQSGPAPRPGAAPPTATPNASPTRSNALPSRDESGPTSIPAPQHRAVPTTQLNGHVERNNGAWRYESHAMWDLRRPRRHQPPGLRTPSDRARPLADPAPPSTSRSRRNPPVSYVLNQG